MRPIRLRLLMGLLLAPRAASAETVDGSGALALAGLLGIVSPLLGAQEKDVLNKLLDGQADFTFPKGKTISVEAAQVACKAGNVDIKSHSCDLSFGKLNVALKGRAAHELYATLIENRRAADAGAGSVFETIGELDCKSIQRGDRERRRRRALRLCSAQLASARERDRRV